MKNRQIIKNIALKNAWCNRSLDWNEINQKSDGVSVTFDDGYANNLTIAAPILERLNIPFTVFATVDYIQNNNDLYLSKTELKELAGLNCATIGSHCVTHSRLTKYNENG